MTTMELQCCHQKIKQNKCYNTGYYEIMNMGMNMNGFINVRHALPLN